MNPGAGSIIFGTMIGTFSRIYRDECHWFMSKSIYKMQIVNKLYDRIIKYKKKEEWASSSYLTLSYIKSIDRCFKVLKMNPMNPKQEQIEQIKNQFAKIKSKEDLLSLLSLARNVLYDKELSPYPLKSLTYYANPDLVKKRYKTFCIKKKSGADRVIQAPVKGLKSLLRSLNLILQCVDTPHQAAMGFVPGKSIVDNATLHCGHNYVLNLDLKDFFHSFDRNRVKLGFMTEPFNLKNEKEPLAFLLASLCTHPLEIEGEQKTVLPQGSPTSPSITNILCKKLDRRLNGLAKRFGAIYSRYADDITFSSQHNIYNDETFNNELKRIIEEDQKLAINPKKTRLQKTGFKQEVTGLIVNEKVNVQRRYIKQIRMWLYFWEKYGYEKADQIFRKDYVADKGHVKNFNAKLVHVLDGKLQFLKMVRGNGDEVYLGLRKRYDRLVNSKEQLIENSKIDKKTVSKEKIDLNLILEEFATNGLNKAMQLFSKAKQNE